MGLFWSATDPQTPGLPLAPQQDLPLHTLWSWSPDENGADTKVFHDGPKNAALLNASSTGDGSPSFLLETTSAITSFASLAIEIPHSFRNALNTSHILRLDTTLRQNNSTSTYARLNLRHGPDTDAIPRQIQQASGHCFAEFDLAATLIGVRPVQHMWLDLIFERPGAGQIGISNLTLSVRPRAQF